MREARGQRQKQQLITFHANTSESATFIKTRSRVDTGTRDTLVDVDLTASSSETDLTVALEGAARVPTDAVVFAEGGCT